MRLKQFLGNVATFGELGKLQEANEVQQRDFNIALAEYDRALEQVKESSAQGWVKMEGGRAQTNLDTIRANCRQMYQYTDPLLKGAVNTITKFVFQQGVDGPTSEDESTQAVLDALWNAPDNQQTMYSTIAQYLRSTQLLLDGNLFVMLRTTPPSKDLAVRYFPVEYIADIITDPLDGTRVLYYKAVVPVLAWEAKEQRYNQGGTKTIFYRDMFNTDTDNDPLEGRLKNVEENCWLQHIAINAVDDAGFGIPEPATSMEWFTQHKKLAQNQAALSMARAAIAVQLKAAATPAQLATLKTAIEARSQNTASGDQENLAGQINVLSENTDLSQQAFGTGASEAWTNSRIFRITALAGMGGIPLHYESDPENATKATATMMERPAFETFRNFQSIWTDAYRKQCDFALAFAGIEDPLYDIPMPPLVAMDVAAVGGAVLDATDVGVLMQRQASAWFLNALGFDDVPAELAAIDKEQEELEGEEAPEPAEVIEEESEWE